MDEVWRDLTLSSLFPPATTPSAAASGGAGGLVFQDFLACARSNSNSENDHPHHERRIIAHETAPSSLFNALAPPSTCPCPGRKRVPAGDEDPIDRKRKRLMKNRESAERSRARRQAYTYELESKVAYLMEENAKLRKQVEKLCVAVLGGDGGAGGGGGGGDQQHKMQRICRTISGPL